MNLQPVGLAHKTVSEQSLKEISKRAKEADYDEPVK
jgi:hypothetical protein